MTQSLAGAQQARFGGGQAQALGFSESPHGLGLEIAGAQDGRVLRRQFAQAAGQAAGQVIDGCRRARLGCGQQVRIQGNRVCRVMDARPIHQRIARHLKEPGSRLGDVAKALPLAHGFDKHILQHVVCGLRIQ